MCRLEAERSDLQEKEDRYCHYLLKVSAKLAKYKSDMKVQHIVFAFIIF